MTSSSAFSSPKRYSSGPATSVTGASPNSPAAVISSSALSNRRHLVLERRLQRDERLADLEHHGRDGKPFKDLIRVRSHEWPILEGAGLTLRAVGHSEPIPDCRAAGTNRPPLAGRWETRRRLVHAHRHARAQQGPSRHPDPVPTPPRLRHRPRSSRRANGTAGSATRGWVPPERLWSGAAAPSSSHPRSAAARGPARSTSQDSRPSVTPPPARLPARGSSRHEALDADRSPTFDAAIPGLHDFVRVNSILDVRRWGATALGAQPRTTGRRGTGRRRTRGLDRARRPRTSLVAARQTSKCSAGTPSRFRSSESSGAPTMKSVVASTAAARRTPRCAAPLCPAHR